MEHGNPVKSLSVEEWIHKNAIYANQNSMQHSGIKRSQKYSE